MFKLHKTHLVTSWEYHILRHLTHVFVLISIFHVSTAVAQWNTQSPVPTYLDLRGIAAPTAQRVFVATDDNSFDEGGSLFESNDGGSTWVQLNIPFSLGEPFNGLFFLDSLNGWAFGNANYRTIDGGATWTQLPFLGSTYFMKFHSATFGLATGNFGYYISYNSGESWVESPNGIFAYDFADELTGLGTSDSALYRTTDGGNTFAPVYQGAAKSAVFLSGNVAVAIVDDAFIYSIDGGNSWTPSTGAEGRSHLVKVSADVVLAWGRSGSYPDYDDRIFRSADGGQTWTDLGEVMDPGIYSTTFSFAVPGPQTVVASDGAGNMFYSSDAGLNWAQTFVSPGGIQPGFLSSAVPSFADAQTGYYGYGSGFLIKTIDGGASWFQISSGSGESLNDIDRFSNGNLIAVGDNGTILTSNGISPWVLREPVTTNNITAVQVMGSDSVVVVDENGQVATSPDGGATWTATGVPPSGMAEAEDIHFNTFLDGWLIGFSNGSGAMYHTVDGGLTWTAVPDFMGAYVAMDMEGSNIWAANVSGRYYRSTDNGNTWIEGDLPGSAHQIQDMDFFDESIGYAVGWWNQVFRSDDGGTTWAALQLPNSDEDFTGIYLLGANELWLSTNDDRAYYSATGGQNWAVLEIGSEGFGNFKAIAASAEGDAWVVGFQGYIEHFAGPPPPPLNLPPVASFDFTTTGLAVEFTDTSFDPDGSIVSWEWDFDDGTGSSLQNPSHTYQTADTYIVSLTVSDNDNDSSTYWRIVSVQPGPGGTFGDFTEVTPLDSLFVTPQDEDFWVITTAPADYDNDGDLDIAVLGYYVVYNVSVEEKLVLLRNDGQAGPGEWEFSYIDVPLGSLTAGSSDMAWGDLDADGDLELVLGTDGATVIYRNDAGLLEMSDTDLPAYWEDNDQADFDLHSISMADFDNDGDLDLLLPSIYDFETFTYRTALMRNDGPNGTGGWVFTETDPVFDPTTHAQGTWADFDGDSDLDLLLVNMAPLTDDGFIRRYRNDGNNNFTGEDILGAIRIEHGEAQWGDYDGDGDLDILIAGNIREQDSTYTLMAFRIYRNDNENYVPLEVIDCIPCEGWFDLTAATWADYDSDGDMDILLAGAYNSGSQIEGRARIYANDGNGIFITDTAKTLPAPLASGTRGGTFSWFDIDGEGDLDYFIAGQYYVPGGNNLVEAQMHLYRNDVEVQNLAPSAPTGLEFTIQPGNTVLLSWLPAGDDHTPGPSLTYNLELYKDDVPVSIPTHTPGPGNVSAVTEWLLNGLENGNYKWTLRAVDAAYVGSPVSVGEFSIGLVSTNDLLANELKKISLGQNFPNPFNETTIISYSIFEESPVTLKVYNTTGEEVAILVNGNKQAGIYEVSFDATNHAEGVYYCRLQAGNFSQTMKMVISN